MTEIESLVQAAPSRPVAAAFIRRTVGFCAMLVLALSLRQNYLTHWDGWDYAAQAIRGHSSDLLLGRWWFIAFMRAAYIIGRELFSLKILEGFQAMQLACALFMAGAVAVGMAWTYRLTRSIVAEIAFAVLIISGPMFGSLGPAVMTEGAALCMLSLSFLAWENAIASERGAVRWALVAGLAFGVMVSMREQAAVLVFWPIISCFTDKPQQRWWLLVAGAVGTLVTLGFGVIMAARWYPWPNVSFWENIGRWTVSMQKERSQFGVQLFVHIRIMVGYMFLASPLLTILALPTLIWTSLKRNRVFWLTVALVPYLITLLVNHDLPVNSRFIMPAAWVLAPVVAAAMAATVAALSTRRKMLVIATAVVLGASIAPLYYCWQGVTVGDRCSAQRRAEAFEVFMKIPFDAMVVPGPATPVIYYLGRLGVKDFDVIESGWGWAGEEELNRRVIEALADGKKVYANLNADHWQGTRPNPEWKQIQDLVSHCTLDEETYPMVRLVSYSAPVEGKAATAPAN